MLIPVFHPFAQLKHFIFHYSYINTIYIHPAVILLSTNPQTIMIWFGLLGFMAYQPL